jgi:GMP synthase-like glutamine amidotransferase
MEAGLQAGDRKMKIGILEAGHVPGELAANHGDYPAMSAAMLGGNGMTFVTYPVVDGIFPDSVEAADGWLITGSKYSSFDDLPWIPRLEEFIRDAYAKKVPVAGICFGHQIMAQALGGRVEKFAGGPGVGTMRYTMGDNEDVDLYAMHHDQVVEAPQNARTFMSSPFCRHAGLAYDDRAISVQAHPEYTAQFAADLIRARRGGGLSPEIADAALSSLSDRSDAPKVAKVLADFFVSAIRKPIPKAAGAKVAAGEG